MVLALTHDQILNGEIAVRVHPLSGQGKAGLRRQATEVVDRILVRTLGMNRLTLSEAELHPGDVDDLGLLADQMHLDAFLGSDVVSPVPKLVEIEVRIELAVDSLEEVEIERRGDAPAIVVGRPDDRFVLSRSRPISSPPPSPTSQAIVESRPIAALGLKLPIVDPGKYTTRRARGSPVSGSNKGPVKSAWTGRIARPGEAFSQVLGRPLQGFIRDVDRQIRSRLLKLLEEQSRLETATAAELDQLAIRRRWPRPSRRRARRESPARVRVR